MATVGSSMYPLSLIVLYEAVRGEVKLNAVLVEVFGVEVDPNVNVVWLAAWSVVRHRRARAFDRWR